MTDSETSPQEDRLLDFADRLRQREGNEAEEPEEPETWVAFTLGGRSFALPVTHVRELTRVERLTTVPGAPSTVVGVMSLRGHSIPVVDLGGVIGLPRGTGRLCDQLLIADHRGRSIGLLVDRIERVVRVFPSQMVEPPDDLASPASGIFRGAYQLDGETLILLAADTFLAAREASS